MDMEETKRTGREWMNDKMARISGRNGRKGNLSLSISLSLPASLFLISIACDILHSLSAVPFDTFQTLPPVKKAPTPQRSRNRNYI